MPRRPPAAKPATESAAEDAPESIIAKVGRWRELNPCLNRQPGDPPVPADFYALSEELDALLSRIATHDPGALPCAEKIPDLLADPPEVPYRGCFRAYAEEIVARVESGEIIVGPRPIEPAADGSPRVEMHALTDHQRQVVDCAALATRQIERHAQTRVIKRIAERGEHRRTGSGPIAGAVQFGHASRSLELAVHEYDIAGHIADLQALDHSVEASHILREALDRMARAVEGLYPARNETEQALFLEARAALREGCKGLPIYPQDMLRLGWDGDRIVAQAAQAVRQWNAAHADRLTALLDKLRDVEKMREGGDKRKHGDGGPGTRLNLAAKIDAKDWAEIEVVVSASGIRVSRSGTQSEWPERSAKGKQRWVSWEQMKMTIGTGYQRLFMALAKAGGQIPKQSDRKYNSRVHDLNERMRAVFGLDGQAFCSDTVLTKSRFALFALKESGNPESRRTPVEPVSDPWGNEIDEMFDRFSTH